MWSDAMWVIIENRHFSGSQPFCNTGTGLPVIHHVSGQMSRENCEFLSCTNDQFLAHYVA